MTARPEWSVENLMQQIFYFKLSISFVNYFFSPGHRNLLEYFFLFSISSWTADCMLYSTKNRLWLKLLYSSWFMTSFHTNIPQKMNKTNGVKVCKLVTNQREYRRTVTLGGNLEMEIKTGMLTCTETFMHQKPGDLEIKFTGIWFIWLWSTCHGQSRQKQSDSGFWQRGGEEETQRWWAVVYLAADHDVSDFGFAVTAVRLVVSRADRQDEIPRMTLALSHQEAAVLSFLCQQLLGLPARQVSVEPSDTRRCWRVKHVWTGLDWDRIETCNHGTG